MYKSRASLRAWWRSLSVMLSVRTVPLANSCTQKRHTRNLKHISQIGDEVSRHLSLFGVLHIC